MLGNERFEAKVESLISVLAEMPDDQFKRLQLHKGDKVDVRISQTHWFHYGCVSFNAFADISFQRIILNQN